MADIEVLLIPTAGPARLVTVANRWEELAKAICAHWIEHVRTPLPGVAMIVDEEGLLDGREGNPVSWILYPGVIVGDVLVCSKVDGPERLDVATLTPEHFRAVHALVKTAAER